ncbi:MAG: 16S rRNA processing protein RimM [Bacteroidetes bacterium]|jgi:16S rRNA processing protein RimM|nr:16S rRNA processing protein RimM [Bacteroidota bacterium]
MKNDRFTEIGRIGKPRGLEGLVRFIPDDSFIDGLFDHLRICYIKNDRGDLVPARIESVSVETKQNRDLFFVKFDMITDRSEAESVTDRAVYTESSNLPEDNEEIESELDILGFAIVYDEEHFGTVEGVIDNPAHPILEVNRNGETMLIPFVDEYVENIEKGEKIIYTRQLDQLFDLT